MSKSRKLLISILAGKVKAWLGDKHRFEGPKENKKIFQTDKISRFSP